MNFHEPDSASSLRWSSSRACRHHCCSSSTSSVTPLICRSQWNLGNAALTVQPANGSALSVLKTLTSRRHGRGAIRRTGFQPALLGTGDALKLNPYLSALIHGQFRTRLSALHSCTDGAPGVIMVRCVICRQRGTMCWRVRSWASGFYLRRKICMQGCLRIFSARCAIVGTPDRFTS